MKRDEMVDMILKLLAFGSIIYIAYLVIIVLGAVIHEG
jgi:hypothetical protein